MRQRSTRKLVGYAATFVALLASVVSATFFITQNAGAQPSTGRVTGTAQAASIAACWMRAAEDGAHPAGRGA